MSKIKQPSLRVSVRPITPQDYLKTIKIIQKTITESWQKIRPAQLNKAFCQKYELASFTRKAQETKYWVATTQDSGEIIGIIGLKENQVRSFFVDPEFQRQGVGRQLYEHLEREATGKGIQALHLEGSPLGEPVYQSFGFKKVGVRQKERAGIHYTDAVMRKVLR